MVERGREDIQWGPIPVGLSLILLIGVFSTFPLGSGLSNTASSQRASVIPNGLPKTTSDFVYVGNWYSSNITVVNESSRLIVTNVSLGMHWPLPQGACFSPTTREVYVADLGSYHRGVVSIINTWNNTLTGNVAVGGGSPYSCVFNPANHLVYVTDEASARVSVIGTKDTILKHIAVGPYPGPMAYDSRNRTLFVLNQGNSSTYGNHNGNVSVIESSTDKVVATLPIGVNAFPSGIAYDPVSDSILVNNAGTVWVFNATTYALLKTFSFPATGANPAFSAFDKISNRLVVAGRGLIEFNVSSGKVIRTVMKGFVTSGVEVSPDPGGVILVLGNTGLYFLNDLGRTMGSAVQVGPFPSALAVAS